MTSVVLDTSVILAGFFREPGGEALEEQGASGIVSSVNYSETLAKLSDRGVILSDAERFLSSLGLTEFPFDHIQAVAAASLRAKTRPIGLSFADRACLACAHTHSLPVLTADRIWKDLDIGVQVMLIR